MTTNRSKWNLLPTTTTTKLMVSLFALFISTVVTAADSEDPRLFEFGVMEPKYTEFTRDEIFIPSSNTTENNNGYNNYFREEGSVQIYFPRGAPPDNDIRAKFPLVYLCTPIHGFTFARWVTIIQPSLIQFLTQQGYAVITPNQIGVKGSSNEVLGAILPNSDAQANGVSLEDVAKRYLNFTVASYTYLQQEFFRNFDNNIAYIPGESFVERTRRNARTRMYTLYDRVDTDNCAFIGFSVGGAIAAYSGAIVRERNINGGGQKVTFMLAPTIGERPGAARKVGLDIWNQYQKSLKNNAAVIISGLEDEMGGLSGARAFFYEAEKLQALKVEVRYATHCHFPVIMSECNFLNVQEDIGGIRALDLALANAAFSFYLKGDERAGKLLSLQYGIEVFQSPSSQWEIETLQYRNDTDARGRVELRNQRPSTGFFSRVQSAYRNFQEPPLNSS